MYCLFSYVVVLNEYKKKKFTLHYLEKKRNLKMFQVYIEFEEFCFHSFN
jgi:hypothetical protein